MNVGVLVLAAGRSERFGSDKRMAALPDGRRMIDALLDNVSRSGLPAIVCIGENDDELARHLQMAGIDCIRCRRAAEGMGGTLAEGIGHVHHWEGVLVTLADMPWILASTYRAVATHLADHTICQPVFENTPGHPVGFSAGYFGELARLGGDIGGRELLLANAGHIHRLSVDDPAILRDVDKPRDLVV